MTREEFNALVRLFSERRHDLSNIRDRLQDEGDRVYLGSTNDADLLREIAKELEDIGWDELLRRDREAQDSVEGRKG